MEKFKKLTYIFIALFIITIFSSFYLSYQDNITTIASNSGNNNELTLKEALTLGLERAQAWDKKASIFNATSVDETFEGTRGDTGKRYNWTINFMVPGTTKYLLIGISNGKVTHVEEIIGPDNVQAIEFSEIKLDSSDLIEIAKSKYNLQQGNDWATGYHYTLDIFDGIPTITVVGIDQEKLFTKIYLDPKNGKVTSAMHKIPNGGGLLSLNQNLNSLDLSKNGMAVKGLAIGKDKLVTWGDKKPREFNTTIQPFLEISEDNGNSWTNLNIKQFITHVWFNSSNELYVSTDTEIWANVDLGSEAKRILSLEENIEYLAYSSNNNIAALSNNLIYSTRNQGRTWEKTVIPETILSLQISDQGDIFILTENGQILKRNKEKWSTLALPFSDEKPNDIKISDNKIVIANQNRIWINEFSNKEWRNIQVDDQLTRLIMKGNRLLGISEVGGIYLINFGGDGNVRVEKIYETNYEGIITDLVVLENKLLVSTIPDYSWEELD